MATCDRSRGRAWLLLLLVLILGDPTLAAPVLTEFMAANDSGLADEDGAFSDWIEIRNPDPIPISLAGYALTDDPASLRKWVIPEVTLGGGAHLIVFASGKNRTDPAAPLHASFQLASEGEYLALVAPDGATVVSGFAPQYPPQTPDVSFGIDAMDPPPAWSFFTSPTPGSENGHGSRAGPIILPRDENPPPTVPGPLTVAVRVLPANEAVASVDLFYRRMFTAESSTPMVDDGTGADQQAGDGVWTGVIPGTALAAGEMTRWRFVATDRRGSATQLPAYRAPLDSDQYFGTVALDVGLRTELPVLHWFTTNVARAGTSGGARGSVFYAGEFYDNVLFTLHGQSSAGFPKKSYNIDFNRAHRFRWSTNAPRVADIDLLTNWADKSKVRHVLAYEVMREAGVAAHFAFTVRVQQNGAFFSTADLVEDADEIYLERAGLNRDGALYKVYANQLNKDAGNTGNTGVEKKTRRTENNSDLQALINGLDLTGVALERYLYDNLDIPRCVNLLAANSVIRNIDMHAKNWYIYRDTGRSGEWSMLPWDLDLSHGRTWTTQDTYFDNALYYDDYVVNGTAIRLAAQLFQNPRTRAMLFRRIRTLTDRFLQPPPAPGTPESSLYYERRLNEQSALIDSPAHVPSDAQLDFEKWGSWLQGGTTVRFTNANAAVETMAEAIQRWKSEYLPRRRKFIYESQIVGRGGEIPLPQTGAGPGTNFTPLVSSPVPVKALVPTQGNLGLAWTGDPAHEPFVTTGWRSGTTGVGYERATGYQNLIGLNVDEAMRANNSVFLRIEFEVAEAAAFDRLQLRMKFDDGFVAYLNGAPLAAVNAPPSPEWNSAATASREANPLAFTVYDVSDQIGHLRTGRNVLAIHGLNDSTNSSDMLIVPELHAGRFVPPSTLEPRIDFGQIEARPASGNQDEEFIQLTNANPIAVDLSDWRLTGAIEHTFLGGTVLPPNGVLHVTPNATAFRARATSPKGGEGRLVQGGYLGHLSNLGETLVLLDARGATNNTTTYPGSPSDAQRFLVISEILFHPAANERAEYLELLNISPDTTLDLRGLRFTEGVRFDFTNATITHLAPGQRVLVVRDLGAFAATFGTNLPVAGAFAADTALNNTGERLKLEDADNETIREFSYDDEAPWPSAATTGSSLVLIAPETNPDPAHAQNWRASARRGGTPGQAEGGRFPVDPEGDANANGEPDLIDYALGNDLGLAPIPLRLLLEGAPTGGSPGLLLIHPLSLDAEGVDLSVMVSTNLLTWSDGTPHLEFVAREILADGRALVTWRVKPPLRDAPSVYLRLRATIQSR